MVNIRTGPIIHASFIYVSMGMYVDNKTVMEHKKHDNPKWNITRIPEFWIGDKSENGEQ